MVVRNISLNRLEEILETVNTNVVKSIHIEFSSSCSSDMPSTADVTVGVSVYRLWLADMDDRYWSDAISYFTDIIKNSGISYNSNQYKQQTCNGYNLWELKG